MNEPLVPLVRFAYDWADTLCDADHGCAPYHKMWPLVRLVENQGVLPAGRTFFTREVLNCAHAGSVHVLLSGGADTGVMALAVEGPLKEGVSMRVTAVDRCRTPLEQMRLYGADLGMPVNTIQCALDQIPSGLDVDAILGHSILSFIPDDGRTAVFKAWAETLRPGGCVLLSQRLAPPDASGRRSWTVESIAQRREDLSAKLDKLSLAPVLASRDDILNAAEDFWTVPLTGNDVTETQIRDHAEAAGLNVIQIAAAPPASSFSPFSFAKQASTRARNEIILQRPET